MQKGLIENTMNKKTVDDVKLVEKWWGYESIYVNNDLYCGKILTCNRDKWSSKGKFHYHKIKTETFIGLEGKTLLQIKDGDTTWETIIFRGESFTIPPKTKHRFMALTEQSKFIEVSSHHEDSDSYYD